MAKRVRTLLRVSSKMQLKDNDIPIQRAEVADYIKKQKDWVFDDEYIERAVSAYRNGVEDREVLLEILEDAKNKEFDILLTYMSDRIGRKEEYSTYVATLNSLGVEVWTIKDGQLKTEEHVDKLLNFIRFWQNEGESKKTGARVRDAQIELVKQGRFIGGKAPYGYELVPTGEISKNGRMLKKLQIVEEQAAIVRKIYSLAIQKGYGYEKIAKALNEEGVPGITLPIWKRSTVCSILTNPIYMGYTSYNRRKSHGNYKRMDRRAWIYSEKQIEEYIIISQEDWERAQEIREARKGQFKTSMEKHQQLYEETYNVPFSVRGRLSLPGLVYCGYCGKRLKNSSYCNHWTIKSTGEERVSFAGRYICPEHCAERSCYSQDYLEGVVFEVVEKYMEHLQNIDITREIRKSQKDKRASAEKEFQAIRKAKKKIQEDIKVLEEKIPDAIRGDYYFSAEKLSSIIKEKEQELVEQAEKEKEINRKIKESKLQEVELEQFISVIPNWKEEFRNADVPTKQMLLSSLIDRIIVKNESINIKFKIRLEDYLPTDPTKILPNSSEKTSQIQTIGSDILSATDLGSAENSGLEDSLPKTVDSNNILYRLYS